MAPYRHAAAFDLGPSVRHFALPRRFHSDLGVMATLSFFRGLNFGPAPTRPQGLAETGL